MKIKLILGIAWFCLQPYVAAQLEQTNKGSYYGSWKIVFKDGATVYVNSYQMDGLHLHVTNTAGAPFKLKLSDIDIEKTTAANKKSPMQFPLASPNSPAAPENTARRSEPQSAIAALTDSAKIPTKKSTDSGATPPPISPARKSAQEPEDRDSDARFKEIKERVFQRDSRYEGIIFAIEPFSTLAEGAVLVNFISISGNNSKADLMRVTIHIITELNQVQPKPALIVFAANGREKMLLDGSQLETISRTFNERPIAAWEHFVVNAKRPDGKPFDLPKGYLLRTTATLKIVDELMPKISDDSASSSKTDKPRSISEEELRLVKSVRNEIINRAAVREFKFERKKSPNEPSRIDEKFVKEVLRKFINELRYQIEKSFADSAKLQRGEKIDTEKHADRMDVLLSADFTYADLFQGADNYDALFPLTELTLIYGSSKTYGGLTVYDKSGHILGESVGLEAIWNSEYKYYLRYITSERKIRTNRNTSHWPFRDSVYVKWKDLKDNIVRDTKSNELREAKSHALSRH